MTQPNPYSMTYTGKQFHLLRPHPTEVDLTSIARSISTKPRYSGHALETFTVLDHLLLCYKLASDPITKLHALMHDMHEAYSGDVVAPFKPFVYVEIDGDFVPFEAVENKMTEVVYQHFRVPLPTDEERARVKRIDLLARAIEMRHFFRNHPWLTNGSTDQDILNESARHDVPTVHDQRGAWRLFCDVFNKARFEFDKARQS